MVYNQRNSETAGAVSETGGAMTPFRLAAIFSCVALVLTAQQDNASILGVVADSSGAVVPNATVEVRNVETGQISTVLTDGNGNFFAPVLRVGIYRLTVSAVGFKVAVFDNLRLRVADRLKVNAQLEP